MASNPRGIAPNGANTLILAFSHQGRRDTLAGIWDWLLVAISVGKLWIPAFAGMTGAGRESREKYPSRA